MSGETEKHQESVAGEERPRTWRPSRPAAHRAHQASEPTPVRIVERRRPGAGIAWLFSLLASPTAKLIVAISLFVAAAIVFEATINGGRWTERPPKPKAMSTERPFHPPADK